MNIQAKGKIKIGDRYYILNSFGETKKEAVDRAKVLRRHYHSTKVIPIPESTVGNLVYHFGVYVWKDRIPRAEQLRRTEDADRKYYGYDPIKRRKKNVKK